ncbi:hypothetical protein ACLHDG_13645 [Sulfurovum sp. CS9]|uniref:hypothetical protein n=1 Tax=Sulfurovum sp. CS9 TaxID=3391146 RepID=UPI0039E873C4
MKKLDLIEDAKKIFIDKQKYTLYEKDYLEICKKFKDGKYNNVRNYYNEAKKLGYLNKDTFGTDAKELNRVLWSFLFANKKSSNDLKVLDASISIYNNSTNTLSKIENSKTVLEYLNKEGHKTYLDFTKHFSDEYGIDIREYKYAKANGFKTNNEDSPDSEPLYGYEPIYNSTRTLDTIMPILKKHKEEFLESKDDGYSMLEREIKKKIIYPVYRQNYGLPTLQVIESNKVVLEFNILDEEKDISNLLKEIYKQEKPYHKSLYSSEKLRLLEDLRSINKVEKFNSICALQKASIIYQYTQDQEENLSLENAVYIYNFHVLLFECRGELKDTCQRHNGDGDKYITCINGDIITDSVRKKEIRKQIKIVKSLLNLNS